MLMSVDYDAIAARFLSILSPSTSPGQRKGIEQALHSILHGHHAGTIFNVDYKDAKDRLSRAVDAAWEHNLQNPYMMGKANSTPECRIVYDITIMGLNDTISGAKKYAKLVAVERPSREFQMVAQAFFDGAVPVALIVKELKSKVVMGRKPNPEAQAKRAAIEKKKTVRTCAVCFRPIAVYPNGLIADHGYQLPHQHGKTASCPGQRFRPLEVSSDGLVYMVKVLTGEVADLESQLAASSRLSSLSRTNYRREVLRFTPASPEWERELCVYRERIKGDLRFAKSSLADYERRLAAWQPTPAGQRYSGGKRRHAPMGGLGKQVAEVRRLLKK